MDKRVNLFEGEQHLLISKWTPTSISPQLSQSDKDALLALGVRRNIDPKHASFWTCAHCFADNYIDRHV
ncbi:hypothetical protein L1987_20876 [Smallanthus sonchifolius]|uniref:Uncharacterized protein n=1 Tax=Smallanthus sonchifolius TaxID=185202 RepID=A0ACB9ITA8_9ASTR|nr:hypothetical protein L1987_20876 [Smallanthus sonchifolius]